jgi:hypothetical protein
VVSGIGLGHIILYYWWDQQQGEKLSGEQGRKNLGHFQNLYNFH